ncbi:phenylacetate--CoA ligase family protein [Actinotalea sp. AC32]|nr:phenylacetate--CoA ligase family protein [Actinotalea sp. AC32]
MDAALLARMLTGRRALAHRDAWTRDELVAFQQQRLAAVREHAFDRSPFYRRRLPGRHDVPLNEVPAVSKAELMAEFDDVLTTRDVRLADVERHLRDLATSDGDPGAPLRRRWWTAATAGTTGHRGVFLWNRAEWSTVLVSYARATHWAGVRAGLLTPLKIAVVSSLVPTHQSAVVGASLRSRTVPTLRLDARTPLAEMVEALNGFQPRVLVGYPSVLRPLARAQLDGALAIRPEAVMSASEVLTPSAAHDMHRAWSTRPNDVYAATETAGISSPCRLGNRHVYDDLVVVEPVRDDGSPVPDGTAGDRLLVTVLFARTLPLIRYELTDRVALSPEPCPCGLPFQVLASIEGRQDDVLLLPGRDARVAVHPNVFHAVLDSADITQWQVEQHRYHVLVRVVPAANPVDAIGLQQQLAASLASAGTLFPVRVDVVSVIPRTTLGKAPLIRRAP